MKNDLKGRQVLLGPGDGHPIPGAASTIKASADDTGGRYSMREVVSQPGHAVPRHVHSREAEAWYMLEGELTFELEDRTFIAAAGSFVHLPVGVRHAFRNSFNGPARFLQIFSPPGLEQYFAERASLAHRDDPGRDYAGLTPDQHSELAAKYGLTFLED